jgi:hypothetical protein
VTEPLRTAANGAFWLSGGGSSRLAGFTGADSLCDNPSGCLWCWGCVELLVLLSLGFYQFVERINVIEVAGSLQFHPWVEIAGNIFRQVAH